MLTITTLEDSIHFNIDEATKTIALTGYGGYGPKGDKGDQGLQGLQGDQGFPGEDGDYSPIQSSTADLDFGTFAMPSSTFGLDGGAFI